MQALQKHSQLQEWGDSHAIGTESNKRKLRNSSYLAAACAPVDLQAWPPACISALGTAERVRRATRATPCQQACAERSPRA